MSIKPRYITVIVTWLVVAGLIIITRFIFKQPAAAATIATNADIVNAINNLQTNLQYTIYAAIAIIITALK
jgi:flagellar basal body-associated protein FliL